MGGSIRNRKPIGKRRLAETVDHGLLKRCDRCACDARGLRMIKLVPDNVSMCSAVAIFSGCQMYAIEELERYGKPVDACGRIRAEEPRWMFVRKAPEQLIRPNGRLELAPIALTCEETGQRLNEKAVGYASPASAHISFLLGGRKEARFARIARCC